MSSSDSYCSNGVWNLEYLLRCHKQATLIKVLEDEKCSLSIVKQVIDRGGNVNFFDENKRCPLSTALLFSKDITIIRELLERGADVNKINSMNRSPLHIYLQNKNCSLDIIQLLIQYGADVNNVDMYGECPLLCAITLPEAFSIIKTLLENGASVDSPAGSMLCMALLFPSSHDVIKLFLDAGCSPEDCHMHIHPLFCINDYTKFSLNADILWRLSVDKLDGVIDDDGQSVLCYAIRHGANVEEVKLLMKHGALLNVCRQHGTPLICATFYNAGRRLREDVIKFILSNSEVDVEEGWAALRYALVGHDYDIGAIKLLLDIPGVGDYLVQKEPEVSILGSAVTNYLCKVEAVDMLLKYLLPVHRTMHSDDTLLHAAVRCPAPDLAVLKFLLRSGLPVNKKNYCGDTPLFFVVKWGFDLFMNKKLNHFNPLEGKQTHVIKELLMAGARIEIQKSSQTGRSLLNYVLTQSDYGKNLKSTLKIIMKFFLLQNYEYVKRDGRSDSLLGPSWHWTPQKFKDMLKFINRCLSDICRMEREIIGPELTLLEFIQGNYSPNALSYDRSFGGKKYDLDQLLDCLSRFEFLIFFDVVPYRLGRPAMKTALEKLKVCVHKKNSCLPVCLKYESVHHIAALLSDDDLLSFILAFHIPGNSPPYVQMNKDNKCT